MSDEGSRGESTGAVRSVGFIGLGNMGGRMARCLVSGGHDVLGFDTRPENIDDSGSRAAGSAKEVAAASDIVLLSLPHSRVVESVVRGDGGILANCRPGQIVVDLSTSEPRSTVALAAELAGDDVRAELEAYREDLKKVDRKSVV